MAITKNQLDTALTSTKNKVSYDNVDAAAKDIQNTIDNVTTTKVGEKAGEIVGGIESVTSKTDVLGQVNKLPTEGLVTSSALSGSINNALNTNIDNLSSDIGVSVSISYTDSGSVAGISTSSKSDASLSSILSGITGLGVEPGYLQNMISGANARGLDQSLNSVVGSVGAFPNVGAVNALSSRTQNVVNQITSSATTDGSSVSTNFLNNFSIEATSAINDVATTITKGISDNNVAGVLGVVSGTKGADVLGQVRQFKNTRAAVVNEQNKFLATLGRVIPSNNLGLMQNIIRTIDAGSLDSIFTQNNVKLDEKDRAEVIRLSQGTDKDRKEARRILREKAGKTPKEIENLLNELDSTIAGSIVVDTSNSVFADPFTVGGEDGKWNNAIGSEDFTFTFISSVEELDAEFRSITREVTEIVVHWTETYSNTNIGSEEINKTQIALGLDGIGYHYVIRRDGSVQRGRPVNNQGQHADVNGHNERSIGVVFVGGINAPTGTPDPLEYKSVSSLTRSQFTSFQEICKAFYRTFPGGQILGHNDLDPLEDDPGFDVRDFCEDLFGKKSLFVDPSSEGPFTQAQINQTQVPS